MAFPKIKPEFELPNLCGAKAPFDAIQKQLSASLDNLNLNIELPAIDIVNQLELDVKDALGKLDGLQMPELPSLPDISLGAEITGLLGIATDSLAGLAQFAAKKLELGNTFGDALSGIGADFESLLGDISGGLDICDVPNMIVPAAGGSPQEKPASTIIADLAPVGEAAAKAFDNIVAVASSNTKLTSAASSFKSAASEFIGKLSNGETVTDGFDITEKQRLNCDKADARNRMQAIHAGVPPKPGPHISSSNAGALNSLDAAAETGGDGVALEAKEFLIKENARNIIQFHGDATTALNILKAILKASVSPFPQNVAVDPDTNKADGRFIYVNTDEGFDAEEDSAVDFQTLSLIDSTITWQGIYNKREELQRKIDRAKAEQVQPLLNNPFNPSRYDIEPFNILCADAQDQAEDLVLIFKEKFIVFNEDAKMTGET